MSSSLVPSQAASDEQLIALWLHGKAASTQTAYRSEVARFCGFVNKPLAQVALGDLQDYLNQRSELSPAAQGRTTMALKSLFAFGQRIGYLRWNVAAPLRAPKVKNTLAERILSEEQVRRLLSAEANPQNKAMLRLLYAAALRISELCGLRWRDLQPRGDTGQVTVFGKGGKTGVVLLPAPVWAELQQLPGSHHPDAFVFPSPTGKQLSRVQAWRIVKRAAKRAGIEQASCHWLRHAHGSHALERGASIALVQQTLRHSNVATTSRYLHVRPNESSGGFLAL